MKNMYMRSIAGFLLPLEKIQNVEFYLRVNPGSCVVKKTRKGYKTQEGRIVTCHKA